MRTLATFLATTFLTVPNLAFAAGAAKVDCGGLDGCREVSLVTVAASTSEGGVAFKACSDSCYPEINSRSDCQSDKRFWVKARDLNDQNALNRMHELLSTGRLVHGHRVVELLRSTPRERHFALCEVRSIRGLEGPPRYCVTMAIETPQDTFIQIVQPNVMCDAVASVQLDGATLKIEFEIITKKALSSFTAQIGKMLRDDLQLEFQQTGPDPGSSETRHVSFEAFAPIRDSKILGGGMRESFNLDVGIIPSAKGFSLSARTKPMICRQASGNTTEYHGLNDAQRSLYAQTLDKGISATISKACTSFKAMDSRTLVCD